MTLIIAPWKMSDFEGAGIDRPGIEHIGFKVESVEAVKKELAALRAADPEMRERIVSEPSEGERRIALIAGMPSWPASVFESRRRVYRYFRLTASLSDFRDVVWPRRKEVDDKNFMKALSTRISPH